MIFIRGARQLVTLRGPSPRRGLQLSDLAIIPDGSLLIRDDKIVEVGTTRRIENVAAARSAEVIDATGKVVTPGFVDSHTRLVFASSRARDWEVRLAGAPDGRTEPYEHSRRARPSLRSASLKVLKLQAQRWAELFAAHGTTTIEARSAHGLGVSSELKGLQVARAIDGHPLDVIPTFLAAEPEAAELIDNPAAAVEQVTEVLLPLISRRRLADCCAVDCDPDTFDVDQTKEILQAAARLGFRLKAQIERTKKLGGTRLALEMNTTGVDHLNCVSPADIDHLAKSSIVGTLLPGVVYYRGRDRYAPARRLIDRGAALALASGFSPDGRPSLSMPMVLSLACTQMGMRPEEAISAATINGAAALDRTKLVGSLEPGKQADVAIFGVGDFREIIDCFGVNLCVLTMKRGKVIYRAASPASSLRSQDPDKQTLYGRPYTETESA